MTHKTWTSGTVIDSAWLQDVDNFVYGYTAQSANLVNFLQYRDWETDRKSTRLNSSHSGESLMPSSA